MTNDTLLIHGPWPSTSRCDIDYITAFPRPRQILSRSQDNDRPSSQTATGNVNNRSS
jgi:hypothetical protein